MVRFYCDRCKKQMSEPIGSWALADKMSIGDAITEVRKVVNSGEKALDEHMAVSMEFCPKCLQELNELVKEFMKKECTKK